MKPGLEIVEEIVLAEIPRGESEVVRLSRTRGRTSRGEKTWWSLRIFQVDGEKRIATPKGLTLRSIEIGVLARALLAEATTEQT